MLNTENIQSFTGHILVIDSGVGGLGVLTEIESLLPNAQFSYVADEAFFPYGKLEKNLLNERVSCILRQIDSNVPVNCVVIACNTASTVVLEFLRSEFNMPIVGIVPAIKVAAHKTKTKVFGVLVTEATARGLYLQTLIREFASDCDVRIVGSVHLARIAEDKMQQHAISTAEIKNEITKLFEGEGLVDQIVLGCTHYPFLLAELKSVVPYGVGWINPAASVAERVAHVVTKIVIELKINVTNKPNVYYSTKPNSRYKNIDNVVFEFLNI